MCTLFKKNSKNKARTYKAEKIVSSISGVGEIGQQHMKE